MPGPTVVALVKPPEPYSEKGSQFAVGPSGQNQAEPCTTYRPQSIKNPGRKRALRWVERAVRRPSHPPEARSVGESRYFLISCQWPKRINRPPFKSPVKIIKRCDINDRKVNAAP